MLSATETVSGQSFRLSDYTSYGGRAINTIIQSGPQLYWLSTYDGVYRLDTSRDSLALTKPVDGHGEHVSNHLFLDPNGHIWSVGRNQLSVFKEGQWRQRQSVNTFQIVAADYDANSTLWIAYGSQMSPRVLYMNSQSSKTYSLSSGQIRDMAVDSRNRVWVAGKNGISRIVNDQVDLINTTKDGNSLFELQSMTQDQEGIFWIISKFGELFKLDPDSGSITMINDQTPLNESYHLASQVDGLWAASKQKICRYQDGEWTVFPEWDMDANTDILDLYINQQGNLMVGTTNGLVIHTLSSE